MSYTFSKLISDAGEDLFGDTPISGVLQNPFDRRSLRTISPNNFPHSLVFNYAAELPFGKGKRFLNNGGLVDRIVGGFQINAIHRYRSNIALIPLIGGPQREFLDLAGYGGNLRPNLTGQPFKTDITAVSATSYRIRSVRYKLILNLAPEITYTTHMDLAKDHDGGREYWSSWEERVKTDRRAAAVIDRYRNHPKEEFYDLLTDPYEIHNLIGD